MWHLFQQLSYMRYYSVFIHLGVLDLFFVEGFKGFKVFPVASISVRARALADIGYGMVLK